MAKKTKKDEAITEENIKGNDTQFKSIHKGIEITDEQYKKLKKELEFREVKEG